MSKYAVEVHNVKKRFSYSSHKNNSLKRAITQVFKSKDKTKTSFYALDGISFSVEKGDFFGILGRNGSGKSTLLKIISEIYQPTSGSVKHDGKVVSFIELGVGFKAELTGKENVYLNAALLGFSRSEIDVMYEDIVEFAELEKFMDQQLKNYSSGMKVRLAFSVAIRAKADILILDEVLAVGDAAFQKKCTDYFETLKEDHKTVILVTHSMGNVRRFCNKAAVINEGKVVFNGDADEAADKYLALFKTKSNDKAIESDRISNVNVELMSSTIVNEEEPVKFKISYKLNDNIDTSININLLDINRRVPLYAGSINIPYKGSANITKNFMISINTINDTDIQTVLSIRDKEGNIIASPLRDSLPVFSIRRDDYVEGKVKPTYAVLHSRGEWN